MSRSQDGRPEYHQLDLLETAKARSLLDQLLADSKLYPKSADYQALLDFVVRLRNFAPFNAMLLQIQKPGLSYAASAHDWLIRFRRYPKQGARPLLILWPFGPVALVYDVQDTAGDDLPTDVSFFPATGAMDQGRIQSFADRLTAMRIATEFVDAGDGYAGSIRVISHGDGDKTKNAYQTAINRNHLPPSQFATLAHELAHLFLGHLGQDKHLNVPQRLRTDLEMGELEAESVAFIVCRRNNIAPRSQTYLTHFVEYDMSVDDLDLYQIMRAAGQVETILGLSLTTKYEKPKPHVRG
jgi:hypothetical protein